MSVDVGGRGVINKNVGARVDRIRTRRAAIADVQRRVDRRRTTIGLDEQVELAWVTASDQILDHLELALLTCVRDGARAVLAVADRDIPAGTVRGGRDRGRGVA